MFSDKRKQQQRVIEWHKPRFYRTLCDEIQRWTCSRRTCKATQKIGATREQNTSYIHKPDDIHSMLSQEQLSVPKHFTEEELKDLRTAFGLLDRNRDGRVTASELQFMLQNLGIQVRDELIHDLLNEASHSGNGLINETEFLQWVSRIQALTQDTSSDDPDDITKDLIAAFRVFDRDSNGYITKDELKSAMDMIGESVTDVQLNEMLAMADIDRDGKINYEEFARLLL